MPSHWLLSLPAAAKGTALEGKLVVNTALPSGLSHHLSEGILCKLRLSKSWSVWLKSLDCSFCKLGSYKTCWATWRNHTDMQVRWAPKRCRNYFASLVSPLVQVNLLFFLSSVSGMSCCLVSAKYQSRSPRRQTYFRRKGGQCSFVTNFHIYKQINIEVSQEEFRNTYISAKLTSISTESLLLILSPSPVCHKQPQSHPQPNPSQQWLKWEIFPWAAYCRGYHGNGRCRNLNCHPPNKRLQWWQTQANSLWKWVFIPDMDAK